MPIRRRGIVNGYWGTQNSSGAFLLESVGKPNGASRAVFSGQNASQFVIYATVDNATVLTVKVAPVGNLSTEGLDPDTQEVNPPTGFMPVQYENTSQNVSFTFTGAGSQALILRNFTPGWTQLTSSGLVNILAGWEATSA